MAEAGPGAAGGYVAFISYSHKDAAMGRWLHRKLEGYRLPKRLVGTQGEDGEVPERLTPIFRDRDELPAAGDLSERVRAALAVSRNLIVICSPNSAASPWVAKEIATFRELRPGRPIFTAIVEGEPSQCFSPALLEDGAEPLAADLRKEGDGRRLGLLKVVAGLAGVGLDALVQRDAARRIRRAGYLAAFVIAAMLAMAFLTAFALRARAEAERQRAEAEGMIEFMLTDLRKDLKSVGNLKVLDAANRRALDYYRRQTLAGLPPASLERRARILHNMGEDDIARNQLDRALASFQEAAHTTARLLAEKPKDPDRIFNQAQSEFWIGHVAYNRGDNLMARQAFERYQALAARLMAVQPGNPRGRTELAYALGNLCTVALEQRVDPIRTVATCEASLETMQQATRGTKDPELIAAVANRYAWLADAHRAAGESGMAWSLRLEQEQLLEALLKQDSSSFKFREAWLTSQFSIADLESGRGDRKAARKRLQAALAMVIEMTRADPTNYNWLRRQRRIEADLSKLGVAGRG